MDSSGNNSPEMEAFSGLNSSMPTSDNVSILHNELIDGSTYNPISVKDWLLTLLIMSIPLLNIVVAFYWIFNQTTHPSKKNFAKAYLISVTIALIGAAIFMWVVFGAFITLLLNG